ncbi:ABC transporter G family member 9-like [Mercurialis annua]|uniref:ABC transporter G family member 9-like n=1 Tax=Mercurialis annua TaxID=3986 RepID=UPI00215FF261|nr:ABC transporter G family member 9-like [Mercurialis annua]
MRVMSMDQEMADIESQTNKKELKDASIFEIANCPITLQFEDIMYKVESKRQQWFINKNREQVEEKTILKGITGTVLPNEMLAILGPSGSGKTTLLTALGGKLGGKLDGTITYNGNKFSNSMKRNLGFVAQDDVHYPHLTVTETLVFTALLRLPNNLTEKEKAMHAENVITQLGLTSCKNTIIGGPFLRGVSGGERKRVSIGQELLINPSLLFLDEPTSGLDSTTAYRIVRMMSEPRRRSIVMTIHQPSSKLFYMFDKVLLLSEGNPLYFGKGSEVIDYFAGIGFPPPLVATNPADFLLDLANGVSSDDHKDEDMIKQALVSAYKSNIKNGLKSEVERSDNHSQDSSNDKQKNSERWATSWWQQFSVLTRRGLKERKNESFSALRIFRVLGVAILSGLLWWKSDTSHLQDQMGLLFAYSGFWGFMPLLQAVFTFPQERTMLEKERSSGMYRLSTYFMSITISDLPLELLLPTIYVLITYWMASLKPTATNFFYTLSVLLLNVLVCQSSGLVLGAILMDPKSASILGQMIMLMFQLTSGFYVQHVPSFIAWIKYLSVSQHAYKLLLGSQYKASDTYPCNSNENGVCLIGDDHAIKMVGLDGQILSVIALGIMLVVFRLIAYIALTRIGVVRK